VLREDYSVFTEMRLKASWTEGLVVLKLMGVLLCVAPKTLLKLWISKDTSSTDDWYKGISEKMTQTLHDDVMRFVQIWKPVLDVVDPSGLCLLVIVYFRFCTWRKSCTLNEYI